MSSEFGTGMKNFAVGAGIGVGVGLVAGILLAPKSGREMLKDISSGARRLAENAKNDMNHVEKKIIDKVESFSGAISKAERNTRNGLVRGIHKASEAAEDTVDAVKEGIESWSKA